MKLSTRDAPAFIARPDPARKAILIYGGDAMRVALKRQDLVAALIGPEGEAEMRFERISGAELRKDRARLDDAMRATGFFPGQRAVLLEEAGDGLTDMVRAALQDWRDGDAFLIVTAGSLSAGSKLRKLFESDQSAYALGVYDDPPSRAEIEGELSKAGLTPSDGDAMSALTAFANVLDPGDFRQFLEKLALYKHSDKTPFTVSDIDACAPAQTEAQLDDLIHIVAESRESEIGPVLRRIEAQGANPVGLSIATLRHFRALHTAASDPDGPSRGIGKLRPPVFGPRRNRMQRQAEKWGLRRLESALRLIVDTDLTLRSSAPPPQMALIERTFIRLSRMGR